MKGVLGFYKAPADIPALSDSRHNGLWETWSSVCYVLGIFSFLKQLLGLVDVLRCLVDEAFDVGEVGQAIFYLHYHFIYSGPVHWQRDGQDL